MNLLDYIIIVTLLILVIKGILKGFIREIASLAGIILGIILGSSIQPAVTEFLKEYIPLPDYLPLISFALVFVVVLILCNIIGWLIYRLFKKAFLGWVDKLLGAGLAAVKCTILIYLVIVMLTLFVSAGTPLIADSVLAPWVIRSYQSMVSVISPEHYQRLREKIRGKQEEIKEKVTERMESIKKGDE